MHTHIAHNVRRRFIYEIDSTDSVRLLRIMLCMQPFNCSASVCGWLPQPQRMQYTTAVGILFPSSCCRKHSSISSRIVQFMFLMTLITWKTPLEIRKRYTLANKKNQPSANSIKRWENGALKRIRHWDWISFISVFALWMDTTVFFKI